MSLRFNNLAETVKHSFGMWINGLWGNMLFDNRGWNFCEQKEAFFILLRRLLDEERVVLFPPDEFWQRGKSRAPCCSLEGHENIWAIPPVAVLTHIRKYWPVKLPRDVNQLTLESFLGGEKCPQIARISLETKEIIRDYNGLWELWEQVMGELVKEHEMACQEVFINRLGQLLAEGKVQLFPPTSLSTLSAGIRAHSQAHLSLNEAAKWRQCLSAFFLHPTCPLMGWVDADTGEAHPGPVKMWSLFRETPEHHLYAVCLDTFFARLLEWLETGEGVLFAPSMYDLPGHWTVPCREVRGFDVWAVSHGEMMDYMQAHWPKEANDANDLSLNDYWYGDYCPRIGWVNEGTGEIVAS